MRASIEFIVFPVMGIINTTKAKYKDGIWTEPNRGKLRFESYAPSKSIGAAQNASARGLNQPPIVFLSSIIPTENPRTDVMIIAKISEDHAPITLVRLLVAKNPLSEKQISNEVLKLTMFTGVLAVITAFMMGVKI